MNEKSSEEVEALPDEIIELAEKYMDFVLQENNNSDSKDNTIENLKEDLEYWNEQLEEFDENDELYSVAASERNEIQEQLNDYKTERKVEKNVRRKFLERVASDFVAKDDWMNETVIRAITHELLGDPRDHILIDESTLPNDEIDSRTLLDVSKSVRSVTQHKLHNDNRINELWAAIEDTKQYPIVEILANEPQPLGPTEIRERLDEEVNKGHVSTYIGRMRNKQFHPYFGSNGEYTLSLVGEYIWKRFGPNNEADELEEANRSVEKVNQSQDSDLGQFSNP